jgi:hypothetical protein
MPKLKEGTVFPTDTEDAQIRAGIAADPDAHEVTSADEWAQMKLFSKTLTHHPHTPATSSRRFAPEVEGGKSVGVWGGRMTESSRIEYKQTTVLKKPLPNPPVIREGSKKDAAPSCASPDKGRLGGVSSSAHLQKNKHWKVLNHGE